MLPYDAELELFRDNFRRFLDEHIAPHYTQWERDGLMPRHVWNQLGENGFLCVDLPEEYGGYNVPIRYSMMLVGEAARAGYSSLSIAMMVHSDIVSPYVLHIGNEEQKRQWLPKMASGEAVGAIAMTEPGAGSDLQNIRTSAVRDGDHFVINGSKTFISNGQTADFVITAVKTDPTARAKGTSLILVDTTLPGFKRGRNLEKIGIHSQDTSELFFEDMRVPVTSLLGEAGNGFAYLMKELPRERLGIGVSAIGAIEGMIEITQQYLNEREAFGQTLGKFQNNRFVLAQAKIESLAVRAFVDECTEKFIKGELDVPTAAAIKSYSTEIQNKVASALLQLFGGYGYMTEYPISRFFVDARVQPIYGGTNEIMKEIVARELLGR